MTCCCRLRRSRLVPPGVQRLVVQSVEMSLLAPTPSWLDGHPDRPLPRGPPEGRPWPCTTRTSQVVCRGRQLRQASAFSELSSLTSWLILMDRVPSGRRVGWRGSTSGPRWAQADDFAALATKANMGGPYCVASGCIPAHVLTQIEAGPMDGLGPAYFIPEEHLELIDDILISGSE